VRAKAGQDKTRIMTERRDRMTRTDQKNR